MTEDELNNLLSQRTENYNLELKAASKAGFPYAKAAQYCSAIANASGGYLILGVNDGGCIVGTGAFDKYHELSNKLLQDLGISILIDEIRTNSGRVLVFNIPKHFQGRAVKYDGKYYIRNGSSLSEMTDDQLRCIYSEIEPDFTSEICIGARYDDLDNEALDIYRDRWARKHGRPDFLEIDFKRMLQSLNLINESEGVTYAALIVLGKIESIKRLIPYSEIIFEWRQNANSTNYDYRQEWQAPFIMSSSDIWQVINARNQKYSIQEGFFQEDIWSFNEKVIREAVVNAVAHRSYYLQSQSIWIKASPDGIYIESPGGFVYGVTIENVFSKSAWRNRLLADALSHVGLMEQSSQGVDDIFTISVEEGKGSPSIDENNGTAISLNIPSRVIDINFVKYLYGVTSNHQISLSTQEILELEEIRKNHGLHILKNKDSLVKKDLVEVSGRGRATKYFLSKEYYQSIGRPGQYTRTKGLTNKARRALIVQHINDNKRLTTNDLSDLMPELNPEQRYNILRPLISRGIIVHVGNNKNGHYILKNGENRI